MRPDIVPQKIVRPLPPERIRRYRRNMRDDIPRGELDDGRGPNQIGLIGLAVFFGGFILWPAFAPTPVPPRGRIGRRSARDEGFHQEVAFDPVV
ncbi:hypothetical protein OVA11_19505 [Caulobacter sp. SL161]|uniref:hypothetical protein n=1 Tax=Caulobacter sp. SL161 TaxID=2995156 RepID=UPI0022742115|nr:hypothetical protein [Caulobacter sp. SL161]MCY1649164.1 hypothetical protein [Caulobacter sp. SL161]